MTVGILYIIRNPTKRDKAEINGPTAMKKYWSWC